MSQLQSTAGSTVAEVVSERISTLAEGPVWCEREETIYWVDILSGRLHMRRVADGSERLLEMGEHLGAVALREKGGLLLALRSGFAFYDLDDQHLTPISNPEEDLTTNRFNDGKCDPSGRFWAGTMSYEIEQGAGSLYCLDARLKTRKLLDNLTISNGMAWSLDRNLFYFIDSPTGRVDRFDYEDTSATISNRETVRQFTPEEGGPDGMTIDREGALWVALYGGSRVVRLNPETGETLFTVRVPAPRVTSCSFGGAAFDELYITTARENMTRAQIQKSPLSGSLFKAKVPFQGLPADRYIG